MPDMLVKLYTLDRYLTAYPPTAEVEVRPAMPYERTQVLAWIAREFSTKWADEAEACFGQAPVSCLIAVREGVILGFACYDATLRGYVGPVGVSPSLRTHGVGARLTLAALQGLRVRGYGYGIIGGVGPEAFYTKVCGAVVIPDSTPGMYTAPLADPS